MSNYQYKNTPPLFIRWGFYIFCKRVDFYIINYRKAHDGLGRAVIMVDQKEVFSMCTIKTESQLYLREWEQRKKEQQYDLENEEETECIWKKVYKTLEKDAIYA